MLTEEDYRTVCSDKDLAAYTQTSPENRARAEALAKEEVSSYLRTRYDCAVIFGDAETGSDTPAEDPSATPGNLPSPLDGVSPSPEEEDSPSAEESPAPFQIKNPLLRQLLVTVSLFYMSRWIPSRIGGQARTDDYERATAYLQAVQSGKVVMDLPRYKETQGDTSKGTGRHIPMIAGGNKSHRYDVW